MFMKYQLSSFLVHAPHVSTYFFIYFVETFAVNEWAVKFNHGSVI